MNEPKLQPNHRIDVRLLAGGKEGRGIAQAHLWSAEEKKKRALTGLAITWGLAVLSVFLPLAHFFLVPAFLIVGPFIFFWARRQNGKITALEAACPFCGEALQSSGSSINWPLRIVCGHCSEQVKIEAFGE